MRGGLSLAELGDLPAVTDLVTAGRALGLGRTRAYELARAGQFPCPVLRVGKTWHVPTAGLLTVLGLSVPGIPPETGTAAVVPRSGGDPAGGIASRSGHGTGSCALSGESNLATSSRHAASSRESSSLFGSHSGTHQR